MTRARSYSRGRLVVTAAVLAPDHRECLRRADPILLAGVGSAKYYITGPCRPLERSQSVRHLVEKGHTVSSRDFTWKNRTPPTASSRMDDLRPRHGFPGSAAAGSAHLVPASRRTRSAPLHRRQSLLAIAAPPRLARAQGIPLASVNPVRRRKRDFMTGTSEVTVGTSSTPGRIAISVGPWCTSSGVLRSAERMGAAFALLPPPATSL